MGLVQHRLPSSQHCLSLAPVVVLVVLPVEELAAEVQGLLAAGEAMGELGAILEGLELALGEVVGGLANSQSRYGNSARAIGKLFFHLY